jgi:uncharacterized protein (DUF342 family)
MEAYVIGVRSAQEAGPETCLPNRQALTIETLRGALKRHRICRGIDDQAVASVVEQARQVSGKEFQEVCVARGEPARDGADGIFEKGTEQGSIVTSGEVVAERVPATQGVDGFTVTGSLLKAKNGKEASFTAEEGLEWIDEGKRCVACRYGRLSLQRERGSVGSLVKVSPDKMQATVELYANSFSNKRVTVEEIEKALAIEGIVTGFQRAPTEKALSKGAVSERSGAQRVVSARGSFPQDGTDARFTFHFLAGGREPSLEKTSRKRGADDSRRDWVEQGTLLAKKTPATKGIEGMNLFGEKLPAQDGDDVCLRAGTGVSVSEDGLSYTAAVAGHVQMEGEVLELLDPLEIAQDELTAWLSPRPPHEVKKALTGPRVVKLLQERGITRGIDGASILNALRSVAGAPSSGQPKWVVARGQTAVNGEDTRFDFGFQKEIQKGTELEDGRVDYRERGLVQNAKKGDLIARRIPATSGEPGWTVRGKVLDPEPGRDLSLEAGPQVSISPDGNSFIAEGEGVILVRGRTVGIYDLFELPGDVDYQTGNLDGTGCVRVRGTVRAGFTVKAKVHVWVEGMVEDARVEAGGDVEVRGGIVCRAQGVIEAGGNIRAAFAENVRMGARGDVVLSKEALNCRIESGGKVILREGKGVLMGGSVRAGDGVEANEIGSEIGVRTELVAGEDHEEIDRIQKEERALRRGIESINAVLGGDRTEPETFSSSKKGQEVARRLLRYRGEMAFLLKDLIFRERRLHTERAEARPAEVRVYGTAYPGTWLTIHGRHLSVEKPIVKSRFYLDREADQIAWGPIE